MVVADASPLIALFQVDQLQLLPRLYGTVGIPPAVRREIAPSLGQVLGGLEWLQVHTPSNSAILSRLRTEIDPGEAEALALALERKALVLVDDLPARRRAQALGLQATGTLGVLVRAKREGLMEAVGPLLAELRTAGFWIGEAVRVMVLDQAGET